MKRRCKVVRMEGFDFKVDGIGIKYFLDELLVEKGLETGRNHGIYISRKHHVIGLKSYDRDTGFIEIHPCYIKRAWMNDSGRWKVKYQLLDNIQGEYPGLVTEVFSWDGTSKSNKGAGTCRCHI